LQTKVRLRLTQGIQYEGTYTWSRSLGLTTPTFGSAGYRDPMNRRADYTLLASHRTHDLKTFGTFELPFGPGRLLGGSTTGWVARLIEGWQVGSIFTASSGAPLTVSGRDTLYASGEFASAPDIVGDFPRTGEVAWGDPFGNFFTEEYRRVTDPRCAAVAANLTQWCTNTA